MRTSLDLVALVVALGAASTAATTAHAQQRDPAAAQALFDEARSLMQAKRFSEACPKLVESQRLDPGIGTAFRLADCYELQGKIASAWAGFLDVASLAGASGQAEREKAARGRAAKLESRLPHLVIVVPAASRAPGLEVRRDGTAVGEAQWGSSVPVDPGEHEIAVTAPGRRAHSGTVSLREGAPTTFTVPELETEPGGAAGTPSPSSTSATAPPATAPAPSSAPAAAVAETPPPPGGSSGPGFAVIGLGGLGVVGLVLGTTFTVMASSKYDDSKHYCRPSDVNLCNQHGVDLRDTAFTYGNVATVGFIVGGVALAGAATLWLTSSGSDEKAHTGTARPRLRAGLETAPGRHGVLVEGSF